MLTQPIASVTRTETKRGKSEVVYRISDRDLATGSLYHYVPICPAKLRLNCASHCGAEPHRSRSQRRAREVEAPLSKPLC